MKRLVAFLLILVVGVAGLGLYLGWFQISSTRDGDRSNVTISVDKSKIQSDKDKAIERLQKLGDEAKTEPAPSEAPAPDAPEGDPEPEIESPGQP